MIERFFLGLLVLSLILIFCSKRVSIGTPILTIYLKSQNISFFRIVRICRSLDLLDTKRNYDGCSQGTCARRRRSWRRPLRTKSPQNYLIKVGTYLQKIFSAQKFWQSGLICVFRCVDNRTDLFHIFPPHHFLSKFPKWAKSFTSMLLSEHLSYLWVGYRQKN